jgi:hypothetical protein
MFHVSARMFHGKSAANRPAITLGLKRCGTRRPQLLHGVSGYEPLGHLHLKRRSGSWWNARQRN